FEILLPNDEFWKAVIGKKTLGEIREIAIKSCGMRTMLEDGLEKINRGITSVEEVAKEIHGY
ncbi:MAG TPA: hypothetical protein P5150_03915, partial [Candidatus Ratteibacteria bacterium]|nr:hypothetical protein [Candidatus Ratteibacteria bacterium]